MTTEAWRGAVVAALQASWRVMIAVTVLCTPPLALLFVSLHRVDDTTAWRLLVAACLLPASMFVHEVAHAATYTALAARHSVGQPELFGIGRWNGGSIVRWRLSPAGDAMVSIAGPLGGISCGLPLLLPGGSFLVDFPFVLVFGVHLLSLRRTADDGMQVRAVWRGGGGHARHH